uniref:Uncharacterized protein AlNc14C12G1474 n=1 Tax=Albugo laibachii Nc14 TaxID=890382 RepID=F0W397_9STRA|nr:hypothetical protein ALNC14_016830 [Albugo laibachii Nc14]|eukprot:CCA15540.1 hypothetical protein ALNC14_016830 [Albugo laibachii Nc14]
MNGKRPWIGDASVGKDLEGDISEYDQERDPESHRESNSENPTKRGKPDSLNNGTLPADQEEQEEVFDEVSIPDLSYATGSWQGSKDVNEDRYINQSKQLLGPVFGIFDGHGGTFTAEYLVRNLTRTVRSCWKQKNYSVQSSLENIHRTSCLERDRSERLKSQMLSLADQIHEINALISQSHGKEQILELEVLRGDLVSTTEAVQLEINQIDREEKARVDDYYTFVVENESRICDAIRAGFLRTDNNLLQRQDLKDGSTALIVWFAGYSTKRLRYFVANAGDCRAVLCRDGKAVPLSIDHKPDRASEKQRITQSGGFVGQIAGVTRVYAAAGAGLTLGASKTAIYLSVSRAFGDIKLKFPSPIVSAEPEITAFDVEEEDLFIVIACDGIWDVMSNEEVVEIGLRLFDDPKAATDAIVKQAYRKKSQDNLTASIIQFKSRTPQARQAAFALDKQSKSTEPLHAIGDTIEESSPKNNSDEIDMFTI